MYVCMNNYINDNMFYVLSFVDCFFHIALVISQDGIQCPQPLWCRMLWAIHNYPEMQHTRGTIWLSSSSIWVAEPGGGALGPGSPDPWAALLAAAPLLSHSAL